MKRLILEDNLVRRFCDNETRIISYHGKRVSKHNPLTRNEIRAYVEKGGAAAVGLIMNRTGWSLKQSFGLLKEARGEMRR